MDVACHRSPSLEHGPAVSSGPGLQEPRRLEDASPDPAHTAGLLRLLPVQRAASKTLDTHASRFHDGHFANDKGTRARVKPRRGGGGGGETRVARPGRRGVNSGELEKAQAAESTGPQAVRGETGLG